MADFPPGGVKRLDFPEPATKAFTGSAYTTWCSINRIAKVLVRVEGDYARIIWDAGTVFADHDTKPDLKLKGSLRAFENFWRDETWNSSLTSIGAHFGFIDGIPSQVAPDLAVQIAKILDTALAKTR